jgi:hypothetical protein
MVGGTNDPAENQCNHIVLPAPADALSDSIIRPVLRHPQRVLQVNIIAEEEGAPSVADIIGRPLLAAEDVKGEDLLAIKVSN